VIHARGSQIALWALFVENDLYDRIGGAYVKTRRPDPRIARGDSGGVR
jgi:hypothetical protein